MKEEWKANEGAREVKSSDMGIALRLKIVYRGHIRGKEREGGYDAPHSMHYFYCYRQVYDNNNISNL